MERIFRTVEKLRVEKLKSSALFNLSTLLLFNLSTLLAATAALAASPAEWDIADTPRTRESVEWIQGDTVERAYRFSDEGEPLDLAAFDSVVWSVVSITNMAEQWAGTTGTVSTVETAVVSFRLTQEESALPVGNYWGFVRGLAGPPAMPRQTTLVQQGIRVRPGPDPNAIEIVHPTLLSAQVASNTAAIATNAANISSNTVELYWQALHLSEHEGRLLANERAIEDLQAAAGNYVLRTNGAWTIVQAERDHRLELNGTAVFAAHADVDTTASIVGMEFDGPDLLLRFFGGSSNRCEACANTEDWTTWANAVFSSDGPTGICRVVEADAGSWYRIVSSDDVPSRTNAWLQAGAPLYLGERQAANQAATKGDVDAAAAGLRAEMDDYAKITGYGEVPAGITPEEPPIAWNLSPTGSTFNALCLDYWRTNWPTFETGGPLHPCFAQATGLSARVTWPHYIPIGEEEVQGVARLVPLVRQYCETWDTSAAGWMNVRSSIEGAEPHFVSTATMVWSEGDPWGYSDTLPHCNATGFWWAVELKPGITGEWAVAIGPYTGRTQVAVLSANEATTNWGWRGYAETNGAREAFNAGLQAMWSAPGKTTDAWMDLGDLATANGVRNPDFWAAAMDTTCVSPWWIVTNENATGLASSSAQHTAITRRHVLAANHWHCRPGDGRLTFYAADGTAHTRGIVRGQKIGSGDCWLGMLDEDLPEGVAPARILAPADFDRFLIRPSHDWPIVSPRDQRGHLVEALHLTCWGGRSVWWDLDAACNDDTAGTLETEPPFARTNAATAYSTFLRYDGAQNPFIGGDSSSPILLQVDGQTILAATLHTGNGGGPNITRLAPIIEAQICAWGGTDETLYWADFSAHDTPTEE